MQLRLFILFGALFLLSLPGVPPLRAAEPGPAAREELRNAYLLLVDAEWAATSGQTNAAVLYAAALARFQDLQRNYPGWQAEAIDRRIADCRNQARQLAGPAQVATNTPPPASTTGVVNAAAPAVPEARQQQLREELARTRAFLSETMIEAESFAALQHRYNELDRINRVLRSENRRLEESLAAHRDTPPAARPAGTQTLALAICPDLIRNEARLLHQRGDGEHALALLREGHLLLPDDVALSIQLAAAYCRTSQYEQALDVLRDLPPPLPEQEADVHLVRGTACMGAGDLGRARIETETALRLRPDSSAAHYNLARILLALDPPQVAGAELHYRRSLETGGAYDKDLEMSIRALRLQEQFQTVKKKKTSVPASGSSTPKATFPTALPSSTP